MSTTLCECEGCVKRRNTTSKKYTSRKLKAMQMVSGLEVPKCINCGCDDIRFLEFDHKTTTHAQRGFDHNKNLATHILQGKVDLSDIDIRCRPCNALDYLEKKYGPTGHKISWSPLSTNTTLSS